MSRDDAPDPAWSLDRIDDRLLRIADALERIADALAPSADPSSEVPQ